MVIRSAFDKTLPDLHRSSITSGPSSFSRFDRACVERGTMLRMRAFIFADGTRHSWRSMLSSDQSACRSSPGRTKNGGGLGGHEKIARCPPEAGGGESKTERICAWLLAGRLGLTVVSWREATKKAHFRGLVFVTWGRGETNWISNILKLWLFITLIKF